MSAGLRVSARSHVGGMKLARLLEASERELARRLRELERGELFRLALGCGALRASEERARFARRRFRGLRLRGAAGGLSELLDGRGESARLVAAVGERRFREHFLGERRAPAEETARACGISVAQVAALRELVDRLFIRGELEAPAPPAEPKAYSAVAGVAIEGGRPALSFFHRDLWKRRWRVDEEGKRRLLASLPAPRARRLEALLRELEVIERRKSTLLRALELALEEQAGYLASGDLLERRALTQRAAADRLDVSPDSLNRLISNKSVQLPWGLEAPLSALFPSRKAALLARFESLARSRPGLCDEQLRAELERSGAARLSRRSIAQYRRDLGLGARGRRGVGAQAP